MDKITSGYLAEYSAERDLGKLDEADQFEAFTAHCVVTQYYDEEFASEELRTGGGGDLGIDAAALIVNGNLVESVEEIDDLRDRNNYLQATIVVVQARTTSGFTGSTITDLTDNLIALFKDDVQVPVSSEVEEFKALVDKLYEHSSSFKKGRPELVVAYATTGTWTNDPHLEAKRSGAVQRLEELNLFDVTFTCFGAREIQDLYRKAKDAVEATFDFRDRISLPELVGVKESYIGITKATEYLNLISDGAGGIRKSLFNDNVRDFQDYNDVNQEIRATLNDSDGRKRFVVLNNGVTIVAREVAVSGSKFTLRDYQIVNGCQTSHVLYDERSNIDEDLLVPVKVIVTEDDGIASSITTATNRQTSVTDEDLWALEAFQKDLEEYFNAHEADQRLFYERRSKQYGSVPGLEKTRIITRPQLVRVYAAMFLDEPWRAGRYYKELLKLRRDEIFQSDHFPAPYYASAVASYRLDFLFRNSYLDGKYKPARYQLLMAIRHLLQAGPLPSGLKKQERYCAEITAKLWHPDQGPSAFASLLPVIDSAVAQTEDDGVLDRDTVRTQQFTDLVLEGVKALQAKTK